MFSYVGCLFYQIDMKVGIDVKFSVDVSRRCRSFWLLLLLLHLYLSVILSWFGLLQHQTRTKTTRPVSCTQTHRVWYFVGSVHTIQLQKILNKRWFLSLSLSSSDIQYICSRLFTLAHFSLVYSTHFFVSAS